MKIFHKLISIITVLVVMTVMFTFITPVLAAESVDGFVARYNNTLINNGGVQCVALANQYNANVVGGGWISANWASDWYNYFYYDTVEQDKYIRLDASQQPQKGDLAVWSKYGGNGLPHIALVVNPLSGNSISCFTQNPSPAHVETLTRTGLLGYVRPKIFINNVPNPLPGVMNVSVKSSFDAGEDVVINWTTSTNATKYGLSVWKAPYGNDQYLVWDKYVTGTSMDIGKLPIGNYRVKMRPYNAAGGGTTTNSVDFVVIAPPVIIPAPTGLIVVSSNYNSIKLTWNTVAGASGYGIYRSTSAFGTYSFLTTATTNSYTNTKLATGSPYYYKIKAYRAVGTTRVYGNQTMGVGAKPVTTAPTNLKAASLNYNSIKLTWNIVTGASAYGIYRSTSVLGTYTFLTTATTNIYTNTKLVTGTMYYYKIKAYRALGTTRVYGNQTGAISIKPMLVPLKSITAASYNSTSIKISWGATNGASGYEIYRSTTSAGMYSLIKATASTYYMNTGLASGKYYYYKVRVFRWVGRATVRSAFSPIKYAKP